jgi:N-acetyl-alpha-D-glucosaminyl L-malate synthase BshA
VDTIKIYGIELLHVHYAIPHAYAGYMAKKILEDEGIYIPMITTLHGTDITLVGKHPFYKPAVTFSINKSDVVTCVSEDLKKVTMELFDIRREIEVIPNFIDKTKYSSSFTDCQRSLMAREDEKIITHISNFRKVKRIDDVIHIFHRISQKIPARLIMVGEGPEKENAELMCEQLGIKEQVLFLGNSNEIDRILCFSDLFLLPSEFESFGLAALEAMINKVAVISSNAGGIPEVNKHGITGFLSNVGDIDDMVKNALYILEDDEILNTFKENAFKLASKFDITNILPLYEAVYEKAYKANYKNSY